MNHCSSCGAPILWARTAKGKQMPIDAEPTADGNVLLHPGGRLAVVNGPLEVLRLRAVGTALHLSHFVTCPNAAEHRGTGR